MDDRVSCLRNKVILITGASGFTGEHACRYFAGLGMRVIAVVRDIHGMTESAGDGIGYYACDLLDAERIRAVVRETAPDFVLHLGGKNSVPESWNVPLLYMESNVLSMLYLLDSLREYPACRILIVGSRLSFQITVSSYRPNHPYSLSKGLQKVVALSWSELFDQQVILAEPCNLIGPGPSTGFCSLLGRRIIQEERGGEYPPFRVSSRNEQRDFLDVRDAVRAYGLLLTEGNRGEIYQVCSGTERTLEEITTAMLQTAGSGLHVEWGDTVTTDSRSQALKPDFLASMGWVPGIPLEESLRDVIHYFRTLKGVI